MELDSERAFFNGGVGIVAHDVVTVEPDGVVFADRNDGHVVPVFGLEDFFDVARFHRVALAGNVWRAGHVSFQGPGNANLDLLSFGAHVDASVNCSVTHLKIKLHDEVAVLFLGPKGRSFFVGAALELHDAAFSGPPDVVLGHFPAVEVVTIECRGELGSKRYAGRDGQGCQNGKKVFLVSVLHENLSFGFGWEVSGMVTRESRECRWLCFLGQD